MDRHAWIFSLLSDVRKYADQEGLSGLVPYIEAAEVAAQEEIEKWSNVIDARARFRST